MSNELTPLPEPNYPAERDYADAWTADQMQAYARAAVAAERERCAALVESRAGMRGTGAWAALTAAADEIRARATMQAHAPSTR